MQPVVVCCVGIQDALKFQTPGTPGTGLVIVPRHPGDDHQRCPVASPCSLHEVEHAPIVGVFYPPGRRSPHPAHRPHRTGCNPPPPHPEVGTRRVDLLASLRQGCKRVMARTSL
jgi:hypothetical protein